MKSLLGRTKPSIQGRPKADATDAAALGPAPLGPRVVICLGRLFISARYALHLRMQ